MRPMIPVIAALSLFFASHAALAQAPIPATPAPATAAPSVTPVKPARVTRAEQRFNKANTTHDGRLTLDQAKAAKMTSVVKNFARIDRGAKGYVTWDDVKTASANARAARTAAKAAAPAKS